MFMLAAAAVWGFSEATLFFIVPDVLLSAMAIRSLRAALLGCLLATAGAMIGGTVMYHWGTSDPAAAVQRVASVPAVGEVMMARARQDLADRGPVAAILGPLSATPYKVYAVQSPAVGIPYWKFMLISPVARLPRFVLVSLVAAGVAGLLRRRLSAQAIYWIWAVAWLGVYAALWGML